MKTPLAAAVYLVLALCLTWPLAQKMNTHLVGDSRHPGLRGDLFFQYNLQQQIREGKMPDPLRTKLLGHPRGLDIDSRVAFSMHFIFYVLPMLLFDLLFSRNLAALLIIAANALAMHLLARERTRDERYAYLAGILFGFSAYVLLKMHQGFVQKSCLFSAPIFFLYLFRVMEQGRLRDQILCAGSMAATLWIYPPYGVFNAIFALPLVLEDVLRRPGLRPLLGRYGALALLSLLGFVFILFFIRDDPKPMVMDMDKYQYMGGYLHSLNLFRWYPYAASFDFLPFDQLQRLPLGFPVLLTLLALAGVVTRQRNAWALGGVSLAGLIIMLGPYLGGTPGGLKLPFYYLGQLPLGSVFQFPIRLFPWILIAILLVGGETILWIRARLPHHARAAGLLVPALLVLSVLENRLVFPEYGRFLLSKPRVPLFLQGVKDEGAFAFHLLPEDPIVPNDYLHWAVVGGRPLANGYIKRQGPNPFPPEGAPAAARERFVQKLCQGQVRYVVILLRRNHDEVLAEIRGLPAGAFISRGFPPYQWLDDFFGRPRAHASDGLAIYHTRRGCQKIAPRPGAAPPQ